MATHLKSNSFVKFQMQCKAHFGALVDMVVGLERHVDATPRHVNALCNEQGHNNGEYTTFYQCYDPCLPFSMLFSTTVNKSLLRRCVHFTFGIATDPLSPPLAAALAALDSSVASRRCNQRRQLTTS
jgi:hypothetical protein